MRTWGHGALAALCLRCGWRIHGNRESAATRPALPSLARIRGASPPMSSSSESSRISRTEARFGLLKKSHPPVYYVVTMLSRPRHPRCSHTAALFLVTQPLLAVYEKPLCQRAATLQHLRLFCDLHLGLAQVLDEYEPQSEPEQFIENTCLTEAEKPNLSNSLKTKGRVLARFFIEKRT
jgi:hypothetical protein